MKRLIAAAVLSLATASVPLFADHIPVMPPGVVELEDFTRLFTDFGVVEPYVELLGRFEDKQFQFRYRSLTVGSYVRVLRNLKVGAFYRIQAGARHNDDWIDLNPGWEWQDTRSRYESVAIADVSPRFILGFLDRNLVFMLKNRYEYNFFNREQSVLVRPGLTYFLFRDRDPVAEISLQYSVYFALNFGAAPVYSHAPYLQILYHVTSGLQLVAGFTYQTITWSTSKDVIAVSPDRYVLDYRAFRFQAGLVYTMRTQ